MRRNEDGMNKIIPLFHMSVGDVLRIGLMGVFVVICIALAIIILMQESKQNGLSGTISGAADSYWMCASAIRRHGICMRVLALCRTASGRGTTISRRRTQC